MSYRAATLEIDRLPCHIAPSLQLANPSDFGTQPVWQRHLDLLPIMVSWSSADGLEKFFNQAWTAFTGVSPSTCRLFSELSLIHPEDRAEAQRAWFRALATRQGYEMRHRMAHRDGSYRQVATNIRPETSANGAVIGWYAETVEVAGPDAWPVSC